MSSADWLLAGCLQCSTLGMHSSAPDSEVTELSHVCWVISDLFKPHLHNADSHCHLLHNYSVWNNGFSCTLCLKKSCETLPIALSQPQSHEWLQWHCAMKKLWNDQKCNSGPTHAQQYPKTNWTHDLNCERGRRHPNTPCICIRWELAARMSRQCVAIATLVVYTNLSNQCFVL